MNAGPVGKRDGTGHGGARMIALNGQFTPVSSTCATGAV
jgi:hypothetical protein